MTTYDDDDDCLRNLKSLLYFATLPSTLLLLLVLVERFYSLYDLSLPLCIQLASRCLLSFSEVMALFLLG